MLSIGTAAPDFTLKNEKDEEVSLSSFRGQKVIVYFYPKDSTPGCTKEACSFRDSMAEFRGKGIIVIGISKDSTSSHRRFIEKQDLNFMLLSDPDCHVISQYSAWGEKTLYGKKHMGVIRTTYLIDENGIIVKAYDRIKVGTHASDILADLS